MIQNLLAVALFAGAAFGQQASSLAYSPPYFPSPRIDGSGDWAAAYVKAREFVGGLTLTEKVNLTTGTGWSSDACVGNVG